MSGSPFFQPVDISKTALILSDVQDEIYGRMPVKDQEQYSTDVLKLLTGFRKEIKERARGAQGPAYRGVPLIVHALAPFNWNSNAFLSPSNKLLSVFVGGLQKKGLLPSAGSEPLTSASPFTGPAIPTALRPNEGFSAHEIVVNHLRPSAYSGTDLRVYLRSRGIEHVVLCGLTTSGTILSTALGMGDDDWHVIIPREGCWDDDEQVSKMLLDKVLTRWADVCDSKDVLGLIASE
ncbi:Isochorismatase hydrolase [Sistotremastrum suecicum HHB10207 ss-3]|uniref:Isochorismatase hydrolase n=1 Tax=Sistotremastrum suecicum HHB10207 ss-3 TaxID=1314776 RepID=A0A166HPQ2_9AGAM|nr:Isochorismatase hydrolase [Sistotremastrum suecicum HHB10207 ss-3]